MSIRSVSAPALTVDKVCAILLKLELEGWCPACPAIGRYQQTADSDPETLAKPAHAGLINDGKR